MVYNGTIEPAPTFMKTLSDIFTEAAALDGLLSQRLTHFDRGLCEISPAWSAAHDALVERLRAAEAGSGAPDIGEPFPDFLLPDDRGQLVSLDDVLATGPAVISFNRGHWCEYCQLELRALQNVLPAATAAGASIIAITPELSANAAICKVKNKLAFPVLCDVDLGLTLSLGLAIPIGERVAGLLTIDGICLPKLHGGAGWLLPIPATFVVAQDGRITARHVDPDFRRRMEPADILAALAAG